jgi:hypothetical protein
MAGTACRAASVTSCSRRLLKTKSASTISAPGCNWARDGHRAYLQAVEEAFGADINYGMLVKLYGAETGGQGHERKYSPSECVGARNYHRQSRPEARQHVLHGAGEPHDADVDAAVYQTDKRL